MVRGRGTAGADLIVIRASAGATRGKGQGLSLVKTGHLVQDSVTYTQHDALLIF